MTLTHIVIFLFLAYTGSHAGSGPTNIIGINNIIDIPNKISGIAGFGPKNSTSGDGTTTVMGSNFGSVIPDVSQQIFGANTTGDKRNDTSSGTGSFGSNFGSILSNIPNQIIGQNTTAITDQWYNKITGNNKTSGNGTDSGSSWPDFNSIIGSVPDKIFGKNKTNSENGTDSGSNGWPDIGSVISGIPDKVFGNNKTSSGNETDTESGNESGFPNFGFGSKKNCSATGPGTIATNPTGGIPNFAAIIPGYSHETKPSDSKNTTSGEDKPRERRCQHCQHSSHGTSTQHDEENSSEPESPSRTKRQTSIASVLGSGGNGLGSLGTSGLGSSASNLADDATLVMGMFQILVKPLKGLPLPGIDGFTDVIKNPQNILTQPQSLLNGGNN